MKCKVYWRKQIKRREIDAHVNDAVKSHHYLQLGGVKRLLALILTQVSSAIEIQNGFNDLALELRENIIRALNVPNTPITPITIMRITTLAIAKL